jgi:hypothetical protein
VRRVSGGQRADIGGTEHEGGRTASLRGTEGRGVHYNRARRPAHGSRHKPNSQ